MIAWLVRLLNVCFVTHMVVVDLKSARVVPLYKGRGDKYECDSFKSMSLLSVVSCMVGY